MKTLASDVRIVLVTKFDRRTKLYADVVSIYILEESSVYGIDYIDESGFRCSDFYNIRDVAKLSVTPKRKKVVTYDGENTNECDDSGYNGDTLVV